MRQHLFPSEAKEKVRSRIIPNESEVSFSKKVTPVYSEEGEAASFPERSERKSA